MTSNSIRAQEAQTRRDELSETKRHNRAQESLKRREVDAKNISTVGGVIGKVIGKHNDPSWYNADPQLVKDTASIPYGRPLGTPTSSNSYYGVSQPGVATLFFVPTIGLTRELQKSESENSVHSTNDSSLASTAAKALYAYVRHANAGSANYDAPDLFQYVLSIDSLLMIHGCLTRLYSILKDTRAYNRYFPSGFVRSMGLSSSFFDSLQSNLANFRAYINVLGMKINAFYYPSQLTYFTRHYWMCSNIFKDQNLKRTQYYQFVPELVFTYDEVNGMLKPVHWLADVMDTFKTQASGTQGNALESIKKIVKPLIEVLLSSESIGIMSGDILKAFNTSALIGLQDIKEDYHVEPTYSEEVLTQIDSATMAGMLFPDDKENAPGNDFISNNGKAEIVKSWTIWQDSAGQIFQSTPAAVPSTQVGDTLKGPYVWTIDQTNQVYYQQEYQKLTGQATLDDAKINLISGGNYSSITDVVVNQYKDDVSPDDTMVATRLSSTWVSASELTYAPLSNTYHYFGMLKTLCSAGSEVLLYARTARFNQGSTDTDKLEIRTAYDAMTLSQYTNLGVIDTYPRFDWAPKIRIVNLRNFAKSATDPTNKTMDADLYDVTITGNFANYASVDNLTLNGMHSTAILSQLGVPYFRGMVASKKSR